MDTPVISYKYKNSQWALYVGISALSIMIVTGINALTSESVLTNTLICGGFMFSSLAIIITFSKLNSFRNTQEQDHKEINIKNKHHELMVENARIKNDLRAVLESSPKTKVESITNSQSKQAFDPKAIKRQVADNHKQLQGNQVTLETIQDLTLTVQNSKDRLLTKQIEYLLKLDELENRLVIDENGIKLV